MELIDKDVLIAEIKKRQKGNQLDCTPEGSGAFYEDGFIIDIINSLEVKKEVDLEKEFYNFLDLLIGKDNGHLSEDELFSMVEYFFGLGLKAKGAEGICKISETECQNFDEEQGTSFVKKGD